MEQSLRQRLRAAHVAAMQLRGLPRGTPAKTLDMLTKTLVRPHLLYAASVWSPRTPETYKLFDTYAPSRSAIAADPSKLSPYSRAAALHRRMAVYLLRRSEGSRPGRLNVPTALAFAEAGSAPIAAIWDAERLRLVGNILCAPEAHPVVAVARLLAADDRGTTDPPATRAWNWAAYVRVLLRETDAGAQSELLLSHYVDQNTWRPRRVGATTALTATMWRAKVHAATFGPRGRLSRAYAARLQQDVDCPAAVRAPPAAPPAGDFETVTWADFAPAAASSGGPTTVSVHATAAWIAKVTHEPARFGRLALPPYRRFGGVTEATRRFEARSASTLAAHPAAGVTVSEAIAAAGGRGFAHGSPTCATCAGAPSLDAWHLAAECTRLDPLRRAALADAAARASASPQPRYRVLEQCYLDVAAALHTAAARNFVALATLGATVDADEQRCMPAWWAKCLEGPRKQDGEPFDVGAAVRFTFPAFVPLARACRKRVPVGVAAPVAPPAAAHAAAPAAAAAVAPPPRRRKAKAGAAAATAAAAAAAATATLIEIRRVIGRPEPSRISELEDDHGVDFDDKDPRRFLYCVRWSNGVAQVLDYEGVERWHEFREYVLLNAGGGADALFELPDDLEEEFRRPPGAGEQ